MRLGVNLRPRARACTDAESLGVNIAPYAEDVR
eukprot:SAG11_NODE_1562_length_4676_cov_2.366616_5_plen_33_part_00